MAKKINQDFAFFNALYHFVQTNKGKIRTKYRKLSKHLLDFNDPDLRADAYLRRPQFEAFEMYVFLKEFGENRHVHQLFKEWARNEGVFDRFQTTGVDKLGQSTLLGFLDLEGDDQYEALFAKMSERSRDYPNYIFALTMGLGKTILMATCIFYEFLLANKFGKDHKYCRNALVFAPDKTVLQSLREIQTFDLSQVVPPEYANFLRTNLKFHFLDDTASTIGAQDGSSFNIIISNTQKIILKRKSAKPSATEQLFAVKQGTLSELQKEHYEMLGMDAPETDADLAVNARFQRIARLPCLGIYVDEAHHSMGPSLEKDLGQAKQASALRTTIDELAKALEHRKSSVVGCYNYTGTPYVKDRIMPEVVYAYGLKTAIDNKYLKQPEFRTYTGNIKSDDFIREVITHFWKNQGETRHEGMLPKLALFASTIDELKNDLQPAIEQVLSELGVSTDKILRNVGDTSLTTNEDIREFNRLDTEDSNKQFILLVGKGGEGWNCRSLFGVALYRKPKSRIFVLQSTMRCLRSIGPNQETGHIYLSAENQAILDDELQQNFRVTTEELGPKKNDTSVTVEVTAVPPPVIIKMKRHRELYRTVKKEQPDTLTLDVSDAAMEQFKITLQTRTHLKDKPSSVEDITDRQSHKTYSKITLVGELARYFSGDQISAFDVEDALANTNVSFDDILAVVNKANDFIYDVLVPHLFHAFFEVEKFQNSVEEEVELIRGYNDQSNRLPTFTFKAQEHLIARRDYPEFYGKRSKSFHLDTYCFDSNPEVDFFQRVLGDDRTTNIYFTGMLVHGQSGFQVYYIHPESHTVCNYHPDFLVYRDDGKAHIIEVKSNWKRDDPVVLAKKEAAEKLAEGNQFEYALVTPEQFDGFLGKDGWDAFVPDAELPT
jgi:hypothetical protein